ncbi:hypothetical protein PoB_006259700 [Plakobranchus ocellatus]|uniref:Uncharacterized protein n=1 Tax=Plakobranchus ocellatus TaxID=259542 RepID=A0AAV4CW09_9GAST|nr:hypothetical protein PoB_006259700 [Plakobranchus ocellatus]
MSGVTAPEGTGNLHAIKLVPVSSERSLESSVCIRVCVSGCVIGYKRGQEWTSTLGAKDILSGTDIGDHVPPLKPFLS